MERQICLTRPLGGVSLGQCEPHFSPVGRNRARGIIDPNDTICADLGQSGAQSTVILVEGFSLEQIVMPMPVLAYFLVMGMILFGGLALASGQLESKPLAVSQRIGVPAPFNAPPDANRSPVNAVDPAATTR